MFETVNINTPVAASLRIQQIFNGTDWSDFVNMKK